jgi:hypothetical protein
MRLRTTALMGFIARRVLVAGVSLATVIALGQVLGPEAPAAGARAHIPQTAERMRSSAAADGFAAN